MTVSQRRPSIATRLPSSAGLYFFFILNQIGEIYDTSYLPYFSDYIPLYWSIIWGLLKRFFGNSLVLAAHFSDCLPLTLEWNGCRCFIQQWKMSVKELPFFDIGYTFSTIAAAIFRICRKFSNSSKKKWPINPRNRELKKICGAVAVVVFTLKFFRPEKVKYSNAFALSIKNMKLTWTSFHRVIDGFAANYCFSA